MKGVEDSESKLGNDREFELLKETLHDEEIKNDMKLLLPFENICTLGDLVNFHLKLIELCLTYELKSKAINASILELKKWLDSGIKLLKDNGQPSKILIGRINDEIQFEKGRLSVVKDFRKSIYKTNEYIITRVQQLAPRFDKESIQRMKEKAMGSHPNLLHNEGAGWMFEYTVFREFIDKGRAAFMTFGTFYDPNSIDVIVVGLPLSTRIILS
jgi:hypothetical protein